VSYSFRPTASDVRGVRPFKMDDTALDSYIDLAATSTFNFLTSSAIPSDTARKHLWALMAAHLASMREPEPESTQLGKIRVSWTQTANREGLEESRPGREFLQRWKRYNRGRVLR